MPPVHVSVHHLTLSVADIQASAAFYDEVLKPLGLARCAEFGDEEEDDAAVEAIAYGPLADGGASRHGTPGSTEDDVRRSGEAPLWLVAATGSATAGAHVAFRASTRQDVQALFDTAISVGGVVHSEPRRWEVYRTGYFGASVSDPDGNRIEFFVDETPGE